MAPDLSLWKPLWTPAPPCWRSQATLLAGLGIRPIERRPFALADDRLVEYDVGVVSLRLDSRILPVVCIFADPGSDPLLGAVALESFMLAADPVNQTLIPVTGRLM